MLLTCSYQPTPLQVKFSGPDGEILSEKIIRSGDWISATNLRVYFFVQLDVDNEPKAAVKAVPFALQISNQRHLHN